MKSGTPSEEEPAAKATVADPKGGLARGRSARFNVYLDKLDSMSLPVRVLQDIRSLSRLEMARCCEGVGSGGVDLC